MTRHSDFKRRVRERMRKTGESYTAARASLLAKRTPSAAATPGVLEGYPGFGGIQGDVAALAHVAAHSGLRRPDGEPIGETLWTGLCGGVGFLYFVFEYAGHAPMLTIGARSRSMSDAFIGEAVDRLGPVARREETGGAKTAARALDRVLAEGRSAVVVVDKASIPYHGMPEEWRGHLPVVVGIAGADGSDVWLDDRSVRPLRVPRETLDTARGRYRKAKHLLVTFDPNRAGAAGAASGGLALEGPIVEAVRDTVKSLREAPFPKFAGNFGLRGLEKWSRLLTDAKDPKGWPKVFASREDFWAGLRRVHECIEHDHTAPAAGRPLYAGFLEEAAALTGREALAGAAGAFRDSGERWGRIAALVLETDDAIRRGCEISAGTFEVLDEHGEDAGDAMRRAIAERAALAKECRADAASAGDRLAEIAGLVGEIHEIESDAADALARAVK